jgi:hypothetical protein
MGGSLNAKNQCVDLANAYISEVLGLPIVLGTNAVDFPKKCLSPNYEYILNTTTAVPIQGDIIIWSSPDGIGHIGICDSATSLKFVSFDQNWPVGSVCKLVNHTYTGTYKVIGWLRGKKSIIEDMLNEEQKRILDFLAGKTEGDVRQAFGALADIPGLNKKISDQSKQIEVLNKQVETLMIQVDDLTTKFNDNSKELTSCRSSLKTANKTISNLIEENNTLSTERTQYKNWYENKCKELKNLDSMTAWQHIRYGINLLIKKSK